MYPAFFTASDGDIILRAGSGSDSQHEFRVHKLILSLASHVFKDMLSFPQPTEPTLDEQHQLPVIDVSETPEDLDVILRFIYPGIENPKITQPPTLTASLLVADKYDISSIYPALKDVLKNFLPNRSVWVYIIASRFGFLEVAREAAEVTSAQRLSNFGDSEDLQHISSADLYKLFAFVQKREYNGIRSIRRDIGISDLTMNLDPTCSHQGDETKNLYFQLQTAVEEAFTTDPCMGTKHLFEILDEIPDPPAGCGPKPAQWDPFRGRLGGVPECPLQPKVIRRILSQLVRQLGKDNIELLDEFFGEIG
jgi:hypothetical protein